jgi:predicted transcriptional regulator
MATRTSRNTNQHQDETVLLLRQLVAIELWKGGVSQAEIGNRLGIASGTVNKYVKGVRRAEGE